jgi:hypothetical protein
MNYEKLTEQDQTSVCKGLGRETVLQKTDAQLLSDIIDSIRSKGVQLPADLKIHYRNLEKSMHHHSASSRECRSIGIKLKLLTVTEEPLKDAVDIDRMIMLFLQRFP